MSKSTNDAVRELVDSFVINLTALIEEQSIERVQNALVQAIGRPLQAKGVARVMASAGARPVSPSADSRLCPVPGCKNKAAPIFGMVCAQHKDLPKAQIKKFRDERKAKALADKKRIAAEERAARSVAAQQPRT